MRHDYPYESSPSPARPRRELSAGEMLRVIFGYVTRISREHNLDRLLMLMADMGKEIVVADRCTVWLRDDHGGELWTRVAHGLDRVRIPVDAGIVGYAIEHDEPVLINDAYSDPRFDREVDRRTGYLTRTIVALPIHDSEDRVIGAYQAINKMTPEGRFTDTDLNHLLLAATYTGNALESAMLHEEIEATQREMIYTLAEAGETRSKETGNHVKRVAEYSWLLGRAWGLSEDDANLLRTASPMHDIGKIGIPDAILLKPGRLDADEFAVMQTHTTLGYEMFRHSQRPMLKAAAAIAHQHHEKWDGSGYPRGLEGDAIHLFGRITAIADVFDALGSERVYKRAWPLEKILNLYREERGRHFDPRLVDLFFDHLDNLLQVRERFRDVLPEEAVRSARS